MSSSSGRYRSGYHGADHYKQRGLLGKVLGMMDSGSGERHHEQYPQQDRPGRPHAVGEQTAGACPKCGAGTMADWKFCSGCGGKLNAPLFCPGCGLQLPAEAKFCSGCGTRVKA